MLLEWWLSYSTSNTFLSSPEQHSLLLSHEPPIKQPPALLLHSQQHANKTRWLWGYRISLQWFFKEVQVLLENSNYDEVENMRSGFLERDAHFMGGNDSTRGSVGGTHTEWKKGGPGQEIQSGNSWRSCQLSSWRMLMCPAAVNKTSSHMQPFFFTDFG